MKTMRPGEANKRGNVVTARIVPIFLLGIIGYSSWVITDRVCINYLSNPPPTFHTRDVGAAVAVLVIFYLLLLIMLVCFARLLGTILTNPGLVPRGAQYWIEKERKRQEERRRPSTSANKKEEGLEYGSTTPAATVTEGYTPRNLRRRQDSEVQGVRVPEFWRKDVFVCNWDGRPPFCSTCYNYKPDRAHHCRELGRCVMKMDHFCPWVGGIVSETSFKFFIQFTGWAAVFCLHTMIVMAYYFAQRRRHDHGFINAHWILALIFAALFFVFAGGMCGSSLQFAVLNSTTIENFTRKTKIWYLAVYMPPRALEKYQRSGRSDLRLITYPRPPEEQMQILQTHGATVPMTTESEQDVTRQGYDASNASTVVTPSPQRHQNTSPDAEAQTPAPGSAYPAQTSSVPAEEPNTANSHPLPDSSSPAPLPRTPITPESRTFAILESSPGANPFDIGPAGNFKEVMGYNALDWFFPLKMSPLVTHADPVGIYRLGPVVQKMAREAGIAEREAEDGDIAEVRDEKPRRKRRKTSERRKGSKAVDGPDVENNS
jgi:palmitoyltransferase